MLEPAEIEKVRLVLASSGWNDVIKPRLMARGRTSLKALALTRSERAIEYKQTDFDVEDDMLRAMIREAEWMAVSWDNEVSVANANRLRDELDAGNTTANP